MVPCAVAVRFTRTWYRVLFANGAGNVQVRLLPLRVADAQNAAVAGEGGQLGDLEFVYELIEAWVVGAVQP